MRQQVNQRRISVVGCCEEWIRRTVDAAKATGLDPVEVDETRVRVESPDGRTHTAITVKYQASAAGCVMHITTLTVHRRKGDAICHAFVVALLSDVESRG